MGTHAEYKLWVGIPLKDLYDEQIQRLTELIINDDAIGLAAVDMHGKNIGIGVVVCELSWGTEIDGNNIADLKIYQRAKKILVEVNHTLKELKIPFTANVYHHIDLGG